MATVAASVAAATGLLYYADQSLGVSQDLAVYRSEQHFAKLYPQWLAKLGHDSTHLYRILELADPNADAIWFEGRTWNYRAMKAQVDQLASGLHHLGVKNGDIVAVFMTNSPEMVFTVYALTRLGAAPALINNALRDDTLLHCVRLPQANLILSTPDVVSYAASAARSLKGTINVVRLNLGSFRPTPLPPSDNLSDFPFEDPSKLASLPPTPSKSVASVGALIYTSGTTGKPKACSIKNALITIVSCTAPPDAANPSKYLRDLRIYSCMPLFHGTTFFTGLSYAAGNSACFVVGRKFSARGFWKEVSESRSTRILYVGELLRFLLATAPGEYDHKHKVVVAAGNGLQKDVWVEFQRRFNVPEIREFYRSTEGLVKFDNVRKRGQSGAGRVGYLGSLRKNLLEKDQWIVKFDYDSEMPIRDPKTGFCVVADRGEPGEAIAKIKNMATYINYHGNTEATEQKLLRDCFEKGDVYQRSGDLLVQERDNWVKFVDRIGDTYRWMGENVSAGEVRGFISELAGVKDAVVVGKRLDKYDGQVGTALIVLDEESEKQGSGQSEAVFVKTLFKQLRSKGVPRYAVPRLVLVRGDLVDVGDTFKHAKAIAKNIAWAESDPSGLTRKYYLDLQTEVFKPLDAASWQAIHLGKAKL